MKTSILDMPFHAALVIMKEWVEAEHGGKLKLEYPLDCPVQRWVEHNNKACGKDMVAGITTCPICGAYICGECSNHACIPLSRVTGYIGAVDGWNNSKKQELQDRVKAQL